MFFAYIMLTMAIRKSLLQGKEKVYVKVGSVKQNKVEVDLRRISPMVPILF